MLQSKSATAAPIHRPPHPIAIVFWNAFTAVHAFFALRAVWGSEILVLLLLFYAVFFGIGIWMARTWLNWARFKRRFGIPRLMQLPVAEVGRAINVSLQFDRHWPAGETLAGSLQWLVYDDETAQVLAQQSLTASTHSNSNGTEWRAAATVPALSAAEAQNTAPAKLELHLQAIAGKGPGWRFILPVQEQPAAFGMRRARTQLTSAQKVKARAVLGWMTVVVLLAGTALLGSALTNEYFSFYRLMFPLGLYLAAYLMLGMRRQLGNDADGRNDFTQLPPTNRSATAAPFLRRFKWSVTVFGLLMFAAFAADAFLPDTLIQSIAANIGRLTGSAPDLKRPDQPATFTLPVYMFNGQSMSMDVTVKGQGTLHGDKLKLHLDELRIAELLSRPDTERMHANKIVMTAILDEGEYVRSVGASGAIALPAVNAERAFVLTNLDIEIALDPRADLDQIWLRIELWTDKSYTPLDATPGHLSKLVAGSEFRFDACSTGPRVLMSPRQAIERQCNDRLAGTLHNPGWKLLEKFHAWKGAAPLIMHAYHQGNVAAVTVLSQAREPIDAPDAKGRTALMMAAWNNRSDFVRALLAAGADPTYQSTPTTHSALSGALYDGYTETAQLMLKDVGALDKQTKGFGYHPAHLVANRGHVATLHMLLEAGLDADTVNTGHNGRGETLLMAAARSKRNSVEMMELLLARGARLHVLDRFGKNAADWSEFFGVPQASDFLCRRGLQPAASDSGGNGKEIRKPADCVQASVSSRP